jgi:glycosyltransferase involved in cell wall biosynthesis
MIRLTAFAKYDRLAASTRQRLLQYAPALRQAGIEIDYRPMFDNDYVASLAGTSRYPLIRIASAYLKRLREVAFGPLGDVVWIYGETLPRLPAFFERLLVRRARPIIYDFDDAFFHNYDDHPNVVMRKVLGGKLEPLLRAAYACTCGNAYVRDYAARFCDNCIILPTAVDTDVYKPAEGLGEAQRPVIGWIGSPSSWAYVRPLLPLLSDVVAQRGAVFRAIGAGQESSHDLFPGMESIEWFEASEVAELQRFDIGIMPVPDEQWARGKSGYKLIQYMACGLPVIASPIGVNREIVRDGENGILATSAAEWRAALDRLLGDSALRRVMGARGRERALAEYSLEVHAPRLVEIVRAAAAR